MLGCCAPDGCTGNSDEQLVLAPTEVEQEEGILSFFAGFINCCTMVTETIPIWSEFEETCWWIVLVNVVIIEANLVLLAGGCECCALLPLVLSLDMPKVVLFFHFSAIR